MMPDVKIKKLYEDSQIPTKGSELAAGWDLYAHITKGEEVAYANHPSPVPYTTIFPGSSRKISVGFAMAIPEGYEGEVRPRSGLASKQGLRPANTPGTIDADYRGEVFVVLHNDSQVHQFIHNGDRIAQMLFHEVPKVSFTEVDELDETDRGSGGFGSTGRQ